MTYKWLRKLVRKISIISKLTATPKKWLRKFCVCVWGEKSVLEGGAYFLLGLKGPCKTIAAVSVGFPIQVKYIIQIIFIVIALHCMTLYSRREIFYFTKPI